VKKLALVLMTFVTVLSGAGGVQEFEFELSDVFYPLLSKGETAKLTAEMIEGIEIEAYYRGDILKTMGYRTTGERIVEVIGGRRSSPPRSYTIWDDEYVDVKIRQTKDGKVRFSVPKTFKMDVLNGREKKEGAIGLRGFWIKMPIDFLHESVKDKPGTDIYGTKGIYRIYIAIVSADTRDSKPSNYAYRAHTPIGNGVNKDVSIFYDDYMGAYFQTVSKLSLVENGKVLPTPIITKDTENSPSCFCETSKYQEPRLSLSEKLYNISSYSRRDQKGYDDSFKLPKLKTLPLEIHRGEYVSRERIESFKLYALSKQKATTLYDLAMKGMKTDNGIIVMDTSVNYEYDDYGDNNECAFHYEVGFYGDEEERYFTVPKTDGSYSRNKIEEGNISSVLAYEKQLEIKLGMIGGKKLAVCKELLSHAKYILSADKKDVIKEFESYRQTLKSAYEATLKSDRYMFSETKNGKPEGHGMIFYKDKEAFAFKGQLKEGLKDGEGITVYFNGNAFKAYYENGTLKDDHEPTLTYFSGVKCDGKFDEKIRGEGRARMELAAYWLDNMSYNKFNYFYGNFTDGVAVGQGEFGLEHKKDEDLYSESSTVKGEIRNGFFDGKATIFYDYHDDKEYDILFQNGKMIRMDGFDRVLAKELQEYLDRLQPFVCDVGYESIKRNLIQ
jgi:hypothetical protein